MESPGKPKTNLPTRYPRTRARTARTTQLPKDNPFERLSTMTATKAASPSTAPMILSIRSLPRERREQPANERRTLGGRRERIFPHQPVRDRAQAGARRASRKGQQERAPLAHRLGHSRIAHDVSKLLDVGVQQLVGRHRDTGGELVRLLPSGALIEENVEVAVV